MARPRDRFQDAVTHLRAADPVMRRLIAAVGPCTLCPRPRKRFATLARAILAQQVSTAAARTIQARLEAALGDHGLTAEGIETLADEQFRGAGLSRQKAAYLRDLAEKTRDGTLRLDRLGRLDDDAVIEMLTRVKGIGRWTAEMFLIFSLGRADVLPVDDLGVRTAIKNLYALAELPGKEKCIAIAAPWRPWATVGAWYCWRSLERARAATAGAKKPPARKPAAR